MTTPSEPAGTFPAVAEDPPGAAILDEIKRFLLRFVILPDEHAANVVTAWIAHTHVIRPDRILAFYSTPRIAFLSKEPASGKTRLLELVSLLSGRGQIMVDPTAPMVAREINENRSTICIDEIDQMFNQRGNNMRPLKALLNAGYKNSNVTIARRGDAVNPFAPVAMAGMGQAFMSNPTIEALRTRTIVIEMRRRQDGEELDEWREPWYIGQVSYLRWLLAEWGRANLSTLIHLRPTMPDGIKDRNADVWEPLLSIGEVAGGPWPERLRAAASHMVVGDSSRKTMAPQVPGQRIINDLRTVFFGERQVSTQTLIDRLYALPDAPWRMLWTEPSIAPRELAWLLAPHNIGPTKIWLGGDEQRSVQGYKAADFAALWPEGTEADQGPDQEPSALPDLPVAE